MKIKIEDYKGQEIFYEEDYDKFTCDISIEDKYKNAKRGSLIDMRKEIDAFIKLNVNFVPFKAIRNRWSDFEIVEFESIRTDGKFLARREKASNRDQIGKDEQKEYFEYNPKLVDEYREAERIKDEAYKVYEKTKKDIISRLKPQSFAKYDSIINKNKQ